MIKALKNLASPFGGVLNFFSHLVLIQVILLLRYILLLDELATLRTWIRGTLSSKLLQVALKEQTLPEALNIGLIKVKLFCRGSLPRVLFFFTF